MSDRMALLEAVAAAARAWWNAKTPDAGKKGYAALGAALSSLPAEPEPEGEMVTLGLMEGLHSGKLLGTENPHQEDPRFWQHVGNLTFRRPARPVVPEVVAEAIPCAK